jgi:hypothetical protein
MTNLKHLSVIIHSILVFAGVYLLKAAEIFCFVLISNFIKLGPKLFFNVWWQLSEFATSAAVLEYRLHVPSVYLLALLAQSKHLNCVSDQLPFNLFV